MFGRLMGVLFAAGLLSAAPAGAETAWLCKPGLAANPCEIGQDTTVRSLDAPERVVTPAAGPREIDCFYVYPTVSNQLTPNADRSRDPELESIAKYQAARFSLECRVFAPIYRQGTLAALAASNAGGAVQADFELAYGDVREAWLEYLARHNGGRGVVLLGHSQGTRMLRWLLSREIETHPDQLALIAGAQLLGGNVTVAKDSTTGGDFEHVPICTQAAQLACVVAYSTFSEDPSSGSRYGRAEPGFEIACTDPRRLAGVDGPFRLLTPSEPFAPGPIFAGIVITARGLPPRAPTTWVTPPDRGEGGCRTINGAHVLRIEPTPGSRRPMWFPEPRWGTHLIDVNIALDALVALVGRQAVRWTDPDIRLSARCARGRLVTRLAGRDTDLVRSRRVRRSSRHVRAVVELRHGARERLVLRRPRPRCAAR